MLRRMSLALGLLIVVGPATARADTDTTYSTFPTGFSLQAEETQGEAVGGTSWDVEGPVSMRGTDTQEVGTFDLKFIIDFATSSDLTDDDIGNRFEFQWGFANNHELIMKLPINYGDGEDGNADISVGWQWRLWEEQDWLPAFAVYNELRVPSGYHSSGVDWKLMGVFTKALVADSLRLHLNPFIKFLGGDNIETNFNDRNHSRFAGGGCGWWDPDRRVTDREFQAGGIIGFDYRMTDTAVMNFDYILDSGVLDGYSMQHSMEFGMDYQLAPNQTFAWSTRWTLDGDSQGDNWGFALSYIITFDDFGRPTFGWGEKTVKYPKIGWEQ